MHLKHRKFWTHIRKMISNINQTERVCLVVLNGWVKEGSNEDATQRVTLSVKQI